MEAVLLEFDWGQDQARNQVNSPNDFNPTNEEIREGDDIRSIIARYINWCKQLSRTHMLADQATLANRARILNQIKPALTIKEPDHPIYSIWATEMALLRRRFY